MDKTSSQLIKKSVSYKLTVTENLEKQIRFLCDKLPKNEYSGTLFYRVEGSFETNDLHIIAVDFYLQDVGSGVYTEFSHDASLAGYMVGHQLFDCYQGLMHSHNMMSTFFSGTDVATLKSEGADTNHFVSLIVNNAGSYTAAVTKKVKKSVTGTISTDYTTFNGKEVHVEDTEYTNIEEIIEYFPLDITIEHPVINKSELEIRLEELQKSTKSFVNKPTTPFVGLPTATKPQSTEPKENVTVTKVTPYVPIKYDSYACYADSQLSLFEDIPPIGKGNEVNHYDEYLTLGALRDQVAYLMTGNIMAGMNSTTDLNKWAVNMVKAFEKRFTDFEEFQWFADNAIDFLYSSSCPYESTSIYEDSGTMWATQLIDELDKYPANIYLDYYKNVIARYTI